MKKNSTIGSQAFKEWKVNAFKFENMADFFVVAIICSVNYSYDKLVKNIYIF